MAKTLQKTYFALVVPAIVLSAGLFVLQYFGLREGSDELPSRFLMISVFVAAITAGAALPIFLRALFFGKAREKGYVTPEEFLKHQKTIIFVISIPLYLAFFAAYSGFETFYFGGTALAAIYAAYYHFPSEKKIAFDKKVFMVKDESR